MDRNNIAIALWWKIAWCTAAGVTVSVVYRVASGARLDALNDIIDGTSVALVGTALIYRMITNAT